MNMTIYGLLKNVKSSTIRLFGVSKEEFISLPVLAILDGMFAPPPKKNYVARTPANIKDGTLHKK